MQRQRHDPYATSRHLHYLVRWDIHWNVIEVQVVPRRADLRAAMGAVLARLRADGWRTEGDTAYGFAFVARDGERHLVSLTARHPADQEPQSFDPHRDTRR